MAIKSELSFQAQKFLEDNYPRVNEPGTMILLQERVFSKHETERIKEGEQYKSLTVIGTWRQLRNCGVARAVIDIVHSLDGIGAQTRSWLLKEIGETDSIGEDLIKQAVTSETLVLVDRPREAHWDGVEIQVDWDRQSSCWEYLEVLARAAKAGDAIDYMDLGRDASPDLPKRRKYSLRHLNDFPAALADCIVSTTPHAQRLKLPADQIRIFEQVGQGDYREWMP